jgi:hypothetical protein
MPSAISHRDPVYHYLDIANLLYETDTIQHLVNSYISYLSKLEVWGFTIDFNIVLRKGYAMLSPKVLMNIGQSCSSGILVYDMYSGASLHTILNCSSLSIISDKILRGVVTKYAITKYSGQELELFITQFMAYQGNIQFSGGFPQFVTTKINNNTSSLLNDTVVRLYGKIDVIKNSAEYKKRYNEALEESAEYDIGRLLNLYKDVKNSVRQEILSKFIVTSVMTE